MFFERKDVIDQNDIFLKRQQLSWDNPQPYNSTQAFEWIDQIQNNTATYNGMFAKQVEYFDMGEKGVDFFRTTDVSAPWLQKDPRMCLTLYTWILVLKSFNSVLKNDGPKAESDAEADYIELPAVVWTYRHPMAVSNSLVKRDSFTFIHAITLWIQYTISGLTNSASLCRVYTSNDAILSNSMMELQRISSELTSKCYVVSPPTQRLSIDIVNEFIDTTLQHTNTSTTTSALQSQPDSAMEVEQPQQKSMECMATNNNDSVLRTTARVGSLAPLSSTVYAKQRELYAIAIQLYCDMESGLAYNTETYVFPSLVGYQ